MKNTWLIAQVVALLACGSGGSDSNGASSSGGSSSTSSSGGSSGASSSSGGSSSGASSSGANDCAAICSTTSTIRFLESNAGGRLEGATVEACFKDVCAKGVLVKKDGGAGFDLPLLKSGAAAGSPPSITARVLIPPGDNLQIEITYDFVNNSAGLVDGDVYTAKAQVGDDPFLFEKSFTATYGEVTECGTKCKVYEVKL